MKHLIHVLSLILCAALLLGVCAASAETLPEIGSEITFGHYEQDEDLTNGQEPIEWIVLDVDEENQKAFLLSKYCLETKVVYPERVPMYWGASTLREWMNGEFLNAAFTAEEQEKILTTTVTNENPHGMKGAGADTEDKLYLLSHEEILHYFRSSPAGWPTPRNMRRHRAAPSAKRPARAAGGCAPRARARWTCGAFGWTAV